MVYLDTNIDFSLQKGGQKGHSISYLDGIRFNRDFHSIIYLLHPPIGLAYGFYPEDIPYSLLPCMADSYLCSCTRERTEVEIYL